MDAREILERRIDELCSENEKLLGQVARLTSRSIRTGMRELGIPEEA